MLRPVPTALSEHEDLWDATSPYGYGGPFGDHICFGLLWEGLLQWMEARNVVSYFGRLPLGLSIDQPLSPRLEAVTVAENVVVDLTRPADDQWRHYEHKVRKNVAKARRAGLAATIRPRFTDVDEFAGLYADTMERRNADDFYRFRPEFFARLVSSLGGTCLVAEVRDPTGALVSAELVLASERRLYSYLGGTRREAFPLAPNDLLKHTVIEYGRTAGFTEFILGGGRRPGDGIFAYKRSFDRDGVVPFRVAHVVADSAAYLSLTEAHAARVGDQARVPSSFFPAYRAPLGEPASTANRPVVEG